MNRKTRGIPAVLVLGLLVVPGSFGCEEGGVCPTIACSPEIALTFSEPVATPYTLSVRVLGHDLVAQCPSGGTVADPGKPEAIASCDGGGFTVSGVDLGHGSNVSVNILVTVGATANIPASAALESILNSRDCPLVCYRHRGIVQNEAN